ncbi:hypothetical protein [Actinomadura roseirufa]|uniref:hypothetical protein n=1 Tax=Actinomadura roseirufa TaxID=2094049 RepID=UPI0013F15DA8|nr:hypothetical protein [Actinomadura roseirufa]
MSRDTHTGVQCPRCQSHLALVHVPANAAAAGPPPPAVPAKEEWTPPPVAEVLAVYADRVKDSATAMRGAARVRESLNRARAAAAQRRTAQRTARQTPKSA